MSSEGHLMQLRPFIHGSQPEPAKTDAALLGSVEDKAPVARDPPLFFAEQAPLLVAAARALADVYRRGGRLFCMGNGGSGCDAAHVAVEFLHPLAAGLPALPAVNLVADLAMISAVGNDIGFDHVFVRQIIAQGRRGDALIGISTSGNPTNLVAGFARARELGMVTIGLAGGDGGRMKTAGVVDYCLIVPTTSVHRVQECHVAAYHILRDLVHALLADDREAAKRGSAAA